VVSCLVSCQCRLLARTLTRSREWRSEKAVFGPAIRLCIPWTPIRYKLNGAKLRLRGHSGINLTLADFSSDLIVLSCSVRFRSIA
jgi:hypothetical protein